jgi:hypothetical protein
MTDRMQLKRHRGWRLPAGAVSVARPTIWGNPFKPGSTLAYPMSEVFGPVVRDRPHAVAAFACHASIASGYAGMARHFLAGKSLACWCPPPEPGQPDVCHAAILLAIANAEDPEQEARCQSEFWWLAIGGDQEGAGDD